MHPSRHSHERRKESWVPSERARKGVLRVFVFARTKHQSGWIQHAAVFESLICARDVSHDVRVRGVRRTVGQRRALSETSRNNMRQRHRAAANERSVETRNRAAQSAPPPITFRSSCREYVKVSRYFYHVEEVSVRGFVSAAHPAIHSSG